jgi:hypothetical protein
MKYGVGLLCLAAGVAAPCLGKAQERLTLSEYCVFDGAKVDGEVYGFASDAQAQQALERVMQHTGLEPNFIIRAANVPNAVATLQGPQRLILYNQQFMMQVKTATNTDWSEISILAHEIGHHLQGHTLQSGGSRPSIELEADKYSGFILNRMGASLDQAQAAMRVVASDQGSATHPGKQARLAAITNGWIKARELAEKKPDGGPPDTKPVPQPGPPVPQPGPTTPQTPSVTYELRAVFPGDPIAYYVTTANDIVAISPQNGQPVLVGKRIPPTLPGFAWMYATPQITYGVLPDGRIMSRNQFGAVFQLGYVTSPR